MNRAALLAGEANVPKALSFLRLLLTAVHVTEKFIFSVCERAVAFSDNEKAAARLCFSFENYGGCSLDTVPLQLGYVFLLPCRYARNSKC